MAIDFFQKEVRYAQQRFNQTFGMLTVCDLRLRQSAIVSICLLGRLGEKIKTKPKEDMGREEIKKFMRIRTALNNIFDRIENHLKERRDNDHSVIKTKRYSNRKSNVGR